jgi:uncharacterized MAPEG superfamily protein
MTFALWCLLVVSLLPLVCAGLSKWGGFDNRHPREWLARQEGWRARANAAQQNSWEALAMFAAAVLTAHVAGAAQSTVDLLAGAFLVTRVLFIACYVKDLAALRSLVWIAGLGCCVGLFVVAA